MIGGTTVTITITTPTVTAVTRGVAWAEDLDKMNTVTANRNQGVLQEKEEAFWVLMVWAG